MSVFAVDVGWTIARPIITDQFTSRVHIEASTPAEAVELAALMCMRPANAALGLVTAVQMPTSASITDWTE